MKNDQRQHPRSSSYIIAEYTVLEGTFLDVVKNIGPGGLSVRTQRKIAVGQPISIEFPLFEFDNILTVTGRVVRKDPVGFAVTFNDPIHGLICKDGKFPEIVHEDDRPTSE